jgi:CheY-like chemotaxis protein
MIQNWQIPNDYRIPLFGDSNHIPDGPSSFKEKQGSAGFDKGVKILVVDDESLIAETVVEILRGEGFEAISVSSGASAVELSKTVRPAVVLSDVMMPGLNGIETGIKIREIVPNCKIILFSGQAATASLLDDARRRGYTFDIIAKPVKPKHLVNIIRAGLPPQ